MPSSALIADTKWGIFFFFLVENYISMFLGNCFWKITTPDSRGRDYGKIKERISIIKIIMVFKILKNNNTIFNIKI